MADDATREQLRGTPAGQHGRFDGPIGSEWKPLDEGGFTAAQADPTTELHGARLDLSTRVRWAVLMPAGVTGYTVTLYRWVGMWRKKDGDALAGPEWVVERVVEGLTRSCTLVQDVDGDRIACRVTEVNGTPTGDGKFRVLYKSVASASTDSTTA